jgi:CRP-like cAMP-binding protein
MMNASEKGNTLTRKDELADYSLAQEAAAAGAHLVTEESANGRREHRAAQLIPFNGLLTNKLLTALPGADFARLLPYLEPVLLTTGQDLYQFGETVDFAYFPETAVISHIYFMEDGSSTAAAMVGREGLIGLSAIFDSRQPSYWTQVSVGGSALRAGMGVIKQEFARGGALQQLLLGYTRQRLAQISQRAVCNGRHKLDERLCTWLLMLLDRTKEDQLPLTHEEIAHHLGARRAGISSCCNDLRDVGIIDYRRGLIRVMDREKLEAAACECYRMMRHTAE